MEQNLTALSISPMILNFGFFVFNKKVLKDLIELKTHPEDSCIQLRVIILLDLESLICKLRSEDTQDTHTSLLKIGQRLDAGAD